MDINDKISKLNRKFDNMIYKTLAVATIERQVEDAYNHALEKSFPGIKFEYPFACDGYCEFEVDGKTQRLLIEYKYDFDMQSSTAKAKVLCQVLYYLKKFEQNGRALPNVCMVADKNECFVMHTNALLKYLDFEGIDWSKAPSSAGCNADLVLAISEDKDINPFVFDVNENLKFADVVDKLKSICSGTVRLVRITEHNVDKVFNVFEKKIVLEKKYQPNDMVALFFNVVTGSEDVYLHPSKKNTLVVNGKNVRVDSSKFKAFCGHFRTTCSPKEKARLAAISDRLITDIKRRSNGAFYTPTPFVDFAHNMLSRHLGENWKDEYVVIDCCCGTKNLTRDYKFSSLYCSTLEQGELDISKHYNQEALATFKFDFLNDSLDSMPKSLIDAFNQNKKILWLINPPYGKSSGIVKNGVADKTATSTEVYKLMKSANIGGCSSMLEGQFLYRILQIKKQFNLTNCNIGVFCKTVYLSAPFFKKFRTEFFKEFSFNVGCLVNGDIFNDVGGIGISFILWNSGIETRTTFPLIKINRDADYNLLEDGIKNVYNIDDEVSLSDWAYYTDNNVDKIEVINLKSALNIRTDNTGCNKLRSDALGFFYSHSNDVFQSQQFVGLFSAFCGVGYEIVEENFDRVCCAFTARKLIDCTWYNDKDQFLKPNVNDPQWQEFVNDSIVYSLFNGKSQQSSLRQVSYHNKLWDIKNEFFWCNPKDVAEWANDCNNDEVYNDANTMPESFVYKKLQAITLSAEAQAVLDKANELLKKSMKYRKLFNDEHPEVQIQNADAGFYQLKQLLKEYMPDELKEFKEIYKKLADKMRPQIYQLGFLRK